MMLPAINWIRVSKNGSDAMVTSLPVTVMVDGKQLFLTPTYIAAQWLANKLGARLLSKTAVDYLDSIADIRLTPHTMPAGAQMASLEYRHRDYAAIVDALEKANWSKGLLVSNAGKDWLYEKPKNGVYNYGWHVQGKPIQGLCSSNCHNDTHTDYSQKARFIKDASNWREWGYSD